MDKARFAVLHSELGKIMQGVTMPDKRNRLILLTACGLIEGDYVSEDEIMNTPTENLDQWGRVFRELIEGRVEFESSEPVSEYILLENVVITDTSNGSKVNMPFMTVFTDQIIGVTIGQA